MPAGAVQSVTFAWDASSDSNVAGYSIYYGTASHIYTNKVSVGNATTATISGLAEGTTYYFAATTSDALNQESSLSEEVNYTAPDITYQPPAITSLPTTNTGIIGRSVALSVTTTGSGPIACQWMHNSNNIYQATNATLTLSNLTLLDAGTYSVALSNIAGSTNGIVASLTVYATSSATLSPAAHSNGQFALNVSGIPNYPYVVQASTNLVDWVSLQTNTAPFTFVDSNASQFSRRFYRTF